MHCRRKWQPTPVFLPGEWHGWRSLAAYSPQSHKESDMTEQLHFTVHNNFFFSFFHVLHLLRAATFLVLDIWTSLEPEGSIWSSGISSNGFSTSREEGIIQLQEESKLNVKIKEAVRRFLEKQISFFKKISSLRSKNAKYL